MTDVSVASARVEFGAVAALYAVACVVVRRKLYVSVEYLNAPAELRGAIDALPHDQVEVVIPRNWRPDNRATRRRAAKMNKR